jgi:hypothetical protein
LDRFHPSRLQAPEVIRSMACSASNPCDRKVDPGERVGGFSPEAAVLPSGDSLRP